MKLNRMYTVMADNINNPQVFVKWMAAIVVATITVIAWFSTQFITTAKGNEMMEKTQQADAELSEQIALLGEEMKASNRLLSIHLDKESLNAVILAIRNNDSEQFQIQQFTSVNGTNAQATSRLRDLKAEHDDLVMKKNCIITKNPLCD